MKVVLQDLTKKFPSRNRKEKKDVIDACIFAKKSISHLCSPACGAKDPTDGKLQIIKTRTTGNRGSSCFLF